MNLFRSRKNIKSQLYRICQRNLISSSSNKVASLSKNTPSLQPIYNKEQFSETLGETKLCLKDLKHDLSERDMNFLLIGNNKLLLNKLNYKDMDGNEIEIEGLTNNISIDIILGTDEIEYFWQSGLVGRYLPQGPMMYYNTEYNVVIKLFEANKVYNNNISNIYL